MLTQLREIVEKVASAPRLNEALDILVNEICGDGDRGLLGLPRRSRSALLLPDGDARPEKAARPHGYAGVRRRYRRAGGPPAEPINLADAQSHPSFKYIPSVKEERYRSFLGVPIISRRQLLGVLVVQQREHRQFDESEESFLVTLATQMAALLSVAAWPAVRSVPPDARQSDCRCAGRRRCTAGLMKRSRCSTGVRRLYARSTA